MTLLKYLSIVLLFISSTHSALAALITHGDFYEELSFPYTQDFAFAPRILSVLNETVSDPLTELDASNESSNPDSHSGHANIDLTQAGLLSLTGQIPDSFGDYQKAVFQLSNLMFDLPTTSILGVNILGLGNELFSNVNLAPLPEVLFTANSVSITYTVGAGNDPEELFSFGQNLVAQFQLVLGDSGSNKPSKDVPAPSGLALICMTCAAVFLRRIRR